MAEVRDGAVALELGARVAPGLGPRGGVAYVARAAQDGAVEGEDAGALEELKKWKRECWLGGRRRASEKEVTYKLSYKLK